MASSFNYSRFMKGSLFVCFLVVSLFANAQVRDSIVDKKALLLKISLTGDGWTSNILSNSPVEIGTFIYSNKFGEVLINYPTEIHESYHVYNSYLSAIEGKGKRVYFLNKRLQYEIPTYSLPTSRIIDNDVNKDVKLISHRYKLYIADSTQNDAHINGLFGLLEEYVAYYFSLKASNESLKFLNDFHNNENDLILELLNNYSDYVGSYYEFRYFIIQYIDKIKQIDYSLYQKVITDKNISALFFCTSILFEEEINLFDKIKHEVLSNIDLALLQRQYSFSTDKIETLRLNLTEYLKNDYLHFTEPICICNNGSY